MRARQTSSHFFAPICPQCTNERKIRGRQDLVREICGLSITTPRAEAGHETGTLGLVP